jgi:hypothetical protein
MIFIKDILFFNIVYDSIFIYNFGKRLVRYLSRVVDNLIVQVGFLFLHQNERENIFMLIMWSNSNN